MKTRSMLRWGSIIAAVAVVVGTAVQPADAGPRRISRAKALPRASRMSASRATRSRLRPRGPSTMKARLSRTPGRQSSVLRNRVMRRSSALRASPRSVFGNRLRSARNSAIARPTPRAGRASNLNRLPPARVGSTRSRPSARPSRSAMSRSGRRMTVPTRPAIPRRPGATSLLRSGPSRRPRASVGRVGPGPALGTRSGHVARPGRDAITGEPRQGRRGGDVGFTLGRIGNRYSGFLSLRNDGGRPSVSGSLIYNARDHAFGRHRYFSYGNYYGRYYRPIHYYGCDYYRPTYGYTYLSTYYPEPYVYRFYDTDVYYTDQYPESTATYDTSANAGAPSTEPSAPTYQSLVQPDDESLIGQGNAAFFAGDYDAARQWYASAMLADERDGYAKLLYAVANFAGREYDLAAVALRRALLTAPALVEYPVDVRPLYAQPEVLQKQLADLARFSSDRPDDQGSMLLMGYLYYASGEPDRAKVVFDRLAGMQQSDNLTALLRDAVTRVLERKNASNE